MFNSSVRTLFAFAFAGMIPFPAFVFHASAADVIPAIEWYDTLGFPNVENLPYVRVATGSWIMVGNQPPKNRYTEGFLVNEEPGAFTVFICSIPADFERHLRDEPCPTLATIRLNPKADGPEHARVSFEKLDFKKVANEALERVRAASTTPNGLNWGFPVSNRVRIFAFGRACAQKGLPDQASAFMDVAANIADEQTGKVDPANLKKALQIKIGEMTLNSAEESFRDIHKSWAELLVPYETFEQRFPASPKAGYAREAADLLRKMIKEEATHHPKPFEQMSPGEQVAECIYQLRDFRTSLWPPGRNPVDGMNREGEIKITPVHRIVALGATAAVPRLIEALDDRRFTHTMVLSFNGTTPPRVMRVADMAQQILEQFSGQNFWVARTRDGQATGKTIRQQVEAWWAEATQKGEKQQLIDSTAAGGAAALGPARLLVEKYPDVALEAITTGIHATSSDSDQSQLLQIADQLPGDASVKLLNSMVSADHGFFTRVRAAEALLARGHPEVIPQMIDAWRKLHPRLNDSHSYTEAGLLIGFLGQSGDANAIEALGKDLAQTPVDVRLGAVEVFLPEDVRGSRGSEGTSVSTRPFPRPSTKLAEAAAPAAERLLISLLDDRERRFALRGYFGKVNYEDPRICDMSAFTLTKRWPEKYRFDWSADVKTCDRQIATIQIQWRSDHGLPPLPPAEPTTIAPAQEKDVIPLLDIYLAASDEAGRKAAAAQIIKTFGLGALPVVRARFEASNDAAVRPLVVALASLVREVVIAKGSEELGAKFGVETLRGQPLEGNRLAQLALEMETKLPPDFRDVSFFAERDGDGTGFNVTVEWKAGTVEKAPGWDRQISVRGEGQKPYNQTGYSASRGGVTNQSEFGRMAEAFHRVLEAKIDAPASVFFRIQRASP